MDEALLAIIIFLCDRGCGTYKCVENIRACAKKHKTSIEQCMDWLEYCVKDHRSHSHLDIKKDCYERSKNKR